MMRIMMLGPLLTLTCAFSLMILTACGSSQPQNIKNPPSNQSTSEEKKIKKAPKLSSDATVHAQHAWIFIQNVEPILLNNPSAEQLEQTIRQPIRQIKEAWLTQVKMNDAVTEGKYALCRKTLDSMDILAREMLQNGKIDKKLQDYQRDKALCQDAIEHPELGNTDPKKVVPPKIS